jgi:branched-chain amino acid transport system ATP-binding protein
MSILQIANMTKQFGGLTAVSNVSFAIEPGQIFALIGPNGAGKTTAVNLISGLLPVTSGDIVFDGRNITRHAAWQVNQAGLTRIYQSGRLFERLTVLENVYVGGIAGTGLSLLMSVFQIASGNPVRRQARAKALSILDEFGLADHADRPITSLSYGQRRMVEFARALMPDPKVILLDEPAAGLNLGEIENLIKTIGSVRDRGIAILLIEHNMGLVMRLADRIAVLNFGLKIAEGTPAEVRTNPAVLSAYLGEGFNRA